MHGYYTYPGSDSHIKKRRKIAIVTQGVKLPGEQRGYTRFRFLAELLARNGYHVDLITSTFQHWDKAQRDTTQSDFLELPYTVKFIYEPGYKKNIDIKRIKSHRIFARNLSLYFKSRFKENQKAYDVIYSEIPPNDMAYACAKTAHKNNIPYVADINDLWPEAMKVAHTMPLVGSIALKPFENDARRTYRLLSAAVGTSDEYALRPAKDRKEPYKHITVYVGNRLPLFDKGVRDNASAITKPDDTIWVTYAGTLGASYDLTTLINASVSANYGDKRIKVHILGDGPERENLEKHAARINAPVTFHGYASYDYMAAFLHKSDILVNSLVEDAAQSIVTKIADYFASGRPVINTGLSAECIDLISHEHVGVNVEPNNPQALTDAILALAKEENLRHDMGVLARDLAERKFNQEHTYYNIMNLIDNLVGR